MSRNPRYDILFEPVRIGPVTAPNRFYQVPHCTGMGFDLPGSLAPPARDQGRGRLGRGQHGILLDPSELATTALSPCRTLWDERRYGLLPAMTAEAIHAHGALAGVELWHGGNQGAQPRQPRDASLSPSGGPSIH